LQTSVTPYPAGPAEASILRPKHRFPSGGYLRPKGRFPPGGYLRPKGCFPSYARGQPEPGKRDQTLQKTQNNYPVHQEWGARPSTILHTLPHEGEDAPCPGGTGASRVEGGWPGRPGTQGSHHWRNEAIYCHWAEGSPKTRRTQGTGQRWGYHVAGPGRNCHRRDDEPLDFKRLMLLSRMPLRRRGKWRDPKSRHSLEAARKRRAKRWNCEYSGRIQDKRLYCRSWAVILRLK
jgi:hypothetical protein